MKKQQVFCSILSMVALVVSPLALAFSNTEAATLIKITPVKNRDFWKGPLGELTVYDNHSNDTSPKIGIDHRQLVDEYDPTHIVGTYDWAEHTAVFLDSRSPDGGGGLQMVVFGPRKQSAANILNLNNGWSPVIVKSTPKALRFRISDARNNGEYRYYRYSLITHTLSKYAWRLVDTNSRYIGYGKIRVGKFVYLRGKVVVSMSSGQKLITLKLDPAVTIDDGVSDYLMHSMIVGRLSTHPGLIATKDHWFKVTMEYPMVGPIIDTIVPVRAPKSTDGLS